MAKITFETTYWKRNGIKVTAKEVDKWIKDNNIPVTKIPLKELSKVWLFKGRIKSNSRKKRIEESNLEFPIYVIKKKDKYIRILDGNHRYAKAKIEKKEVIDSYILEYEKLPDDYKTALIKK